MDALTQPYSQTGHQPERQIKEPDLTSRVFLCLQFSRSICSSVVGFAVMRDMTLPGTLTAYKDYDYDRM